MHLENIKAFCTAFIYKYKVAEFLDISKLDKLVITTS